MIEYQEYTPAEATVHFYAVEIIEYLNRIIPRDNEIPFLPLALASMATALGKIAQDGVIETVEAEQKMIYQITNHLTGIFNDRRENKEIA
jgi:hypothetical protein